MGKKVNVVRPDGTVESVDEDTLNTAQGIAGTPARETSYQAFNRSEGEASQKRTEGFLGGLASFAGGAADTITGGGFGKLMNAIGDPEQASYLRAAEQNHSTANTAGAIAGAFLPNPAAELGLGVKAATGSKVLGRVAEGAGFGVTGTIAHSNITGDPLTIESLAESAGTGAILNVGMGALGDGLVKAAGKAKTAEASAAALRDDLVTAKTGAKAFTDSPPSWQDVQEAIKARNQSVKKAATDWQKAADKYDAFHGNNQKLTGAIKQTEKVVNDISARYAESAEARVSKVTTKGKTPKFDVSDTGYTPGSSDYLDSASQASAMANPGEAAEVGDVAARPPGQFDLSDVGGESGLGQQQIPALSAPEPSPFDLSDTAPSGGKLGTDSGMGFDTSDVGEPQASADLPGMTDAAGPTPGAPQVSTYERLKEYRARISDMYKKKAGGWEATGSAAWKRNPSVPADTAGAMEDLRKLNAEIEQAFPKASGGLKEIPEPPPGVKPNADASPLPKSLRDFARMSPERAAAVANGMDQNTAKAFAKLADDLGIAQGATPGETVAGMQSSLRGYSDAIDRVKAAAEREASRPVGPRVVDWLQAFARRSVSYATARVVDDVVGRGFWGAMSRVATRESVYWGMTKAEEAFMGGASVEAKLGSQSKIRSLIANYGEPAGKTLTALGPVTSYLSYSFPSGKKDSETNPVQLALNRMDEINRAAQVSNDAMFVTVQHLMGHPSDIGFKLHEQVIKAVQLLQQYMPKDPGTNYTLFKSNWKMSSHERKLLAHLLEAVQSPINAMARTIAGGGHPVVSSVLNALWPNLMTVASQELALASPKLHTLSANRTKGYSMLFGQPMASPQRQPQLAALQAVSTPSSPPGSISKAKKATGRPAAVTNQVAGSSPGNLISQ